MPEIIGREVFEEFRSVTGRLGLLDAILPPVLFLFLNAVAGFQTAVAGALSTAVLTGLVRLRRRQSPLFALTGMGSVGLTVGLAFLLGRSEGYFLPAILNGGITIALALASLLVRKPLVAWSSYFARHWPLQWYWHARVRPAYTEVTLAWILFFSLRLIWQVTLFQGHDADPLAWINALTGWPATILVLFLSYFYGTWRLVKLGGPSVEEFRSNLPAPWLSQRRGF